MDVPLIDRAADPAAAVLIARVCKVGASRWGAVVVAAAAGIGAMFLPPASATSVSWAGTTGDD